MTEAEKELIALRLWKIEFEYTQENGKP